MTGAQHRPLVAIATLVALTGVIGVAGCLETEDRTVDPPVTWESIDLREPSGVDLLFVVDNSNSMSEEQALLAEQFGVLLDTLSASGLDAARSVRVGVVDSDMGTAGYTIQTCQNPATGDDGALQNLGRLPGCEDRYEAVDCPDGETCPWLSWSSGDDETTVWDDFACIASLGTGGCGFEQPLEAALVGAMEQTEPGGANAGFVRDDTVLAVVWVTDEDDCSSANPEMFNPSNDRLGPLCVRCMLNPDELHPLERYADGLRSLRPGNEDLVVVGGIAGVPADGSDWLEPPRLRTLRDMQDVDPANPNSALRSCDTALGAAYPPVRIAELISMFGDNGVLGSICRVDWSDTLDRLGETIRDRLESRCLAAAPAAPETCRVVETLEHDGPCPDLDGIDGVDRDLGLDDGARRCSVPAATEELAGWHLDRSGAACERGELALSDPSLDVDLHRVQLECPVTGGEEAM